MNMEMLKQELKKIHTDLSSNSQKAFVNHGSEKLFIENEYSKWSVYVRKYENTSLLDEIIDLKEYSLESEACADFLQREKEYQKIKEYEEKFNDNPIELIVATGPLGFSGYRFVNEQYVYGIEIIGWCGNDNIVNQGRAELVRIMTSEEATELRKHFAVDSIYRVKVRSRKEDCNNIIYFYLDEILEKTTHTELQKIIDNTLVPISITDEHLGNIVWDRKIKVFDVWFELWNGKATLSIGLNDVEELKKYLPTIKKHIAWIQDHKEKLFNEIATDYFVDLANEWRPCTTDGISYYEINDEKFEREITKEIFVNALDTGMCSMDLDINDDEYSYSIYFDTTQPDLFAGHCIEMSLDVNDDNYELTVMGIAG